MKVKALCVSILALAFAVSAHAQNISTVYGSGYAALNGDTATTVSIFAPYAVVLDGLGDTYFATENVVYEMSAAGVLTLVAGNGTYGYSGDTMAATSAELSQIAGLALDSSGDLYIADTGNCVIRMVAATTAGPYTAGDIYTVVGNGTCGYGGDHGAATSAELNYPDGLAFDGSGNLYIADSDNFAIREVSSGTITTVAGIPLSAGYTGNGGLATSAKLGDPEGVAVDGNGNIYIADTANEVIRVVAGSTPPLGDTTGHIYTVAGTPLTTGYSGDNGAATSATLDSPENVAVDSYGNFYIADADNNAVREVVVATGIISTVAGNGSKGYTGNGGLATKAELNDPTGVTIDSYGDIFIADAENYVIREVVAATADISTIAGNGYYSYSGDGGPAANAQLHLPQGMTVDSFGNVYIADTGNHVIREINVSTGNISTVAGNGIEGYTGDSGAATSAELVDPVGVAVDNAGDIYISDYGYDILGYNSEVIREVSGLTGMIYTFAGTGECGYSNDGSVATIAELCKPAGLALDLSGNLYIADSGNARIREVDAATNVITTVAGDGTVGYFGDGGLATSAHLDSPLGVALDTAGDLFIADTNNYVIREVSQNPADHADLGKITTVAGNNCDCGFVVSTTPHPALDVAFVWAPGVFVDYAGNIFVTDHDGSEVYEVTGSSFTLPANGSIFTVAGDGVDGYTGDGGAATSAELSAPYDSIGDFSGNLLIADSNNDVVRGVPGLIVSAPESVLTANSLTFAVQLLNSGASQSQTINVTNPGNHSVSITSDAVSGANAADFVITADSCAGMVLAPAGPGCAITVTFEATVAGPEAATLTIVSNIPASPQIIPLSGAGITFAAAVAAPGGSTSATVSSTGLAIYQLQISVTGGSATSDSLTLALSCSGAPVDAACEIPTQVTVTAGTPAPINVMVQASVSKITKNNDGPLERFRDHFKGGMTLALIPFGLIALGLARKRRKLTGLFLLVLFAVMVSLSGCNTVTGAPTTTPAGNYTVVLKATSGNVSQSTSLSLTVQ
jgi:sugar lactone lactonase YvrE